MRNEIQRIMSWNGVAGSTPDTYNPELEIALLTEEFIETINAIKNNDKIEALDGVIDMFVVGIGTLYKLEMKSNKVAQAINEVLDSNDSKFFVDNRGLKYAKKNEAGKIQKGDNFFKPDLKKYI